MEASDFALRFSDLLFDARKVFASLLELMECAHARFLEFDVPCEFLFQFAFDTALIFLRARQVGLRFRSEAFEANDFGFVHPQFAFQSERAGFAGTAAGDHAAVVARAVERDEILLRIFASQFFGLGGGFDQISAFEFGQELLGRGAKRVAEFDEAVEARDDARGGKRCGVGPWLVLHLAQ